MLQNLQNFRLKQTKFEVMMRNMLVRRPMDLIICIKAFWPDMPVIEQGWERGRYDLISDAEWSIELACHLSIAPISSFYLPPDTS